MQLKAKARQLRKAQTDAERSLWRHLRDRRFADFKFRRQHIIGHFIVDFQDDPLGAVFAVGGFIFALDDGEGFHNVIDIISLDVIKVEVGGIQLTAEQEAALFIAALVTALITGGAGYVTRTDLSDYLSPEKDNGQS